MAYDPAKAALFNKLRQQGLSEEAAFQQAGITGNAEFAYTINEVGSPDPKAINYNPNYGQLEKSGFANATAKSDKLTPAEEEADPDVEEQVTRTKTTPVASTTTTTTTETVSGGGTRTVISQPAQKVDSAVTQELQNKADAIAAERNELAAQLKAEGLTTAQVRSDPRYKELNTKFVEAQNAADSSTLGVPGTGSTTITTTPNSTATTTTVETSSPSYLTKNAGGDDPTVQDQEISQTPARVSASQVQTSPTNLAADPNTNLGTEGQVANTPSTTVTEDPLAIAAAEAQAANEALAGEPPTETAVDVGPEDPETANLREQAQEINRAQLALEATDVEPGPGTGQEGQNTANNAADEVAAQQAADASVGKRLAQEQAAKRAAENVPSQADWRVRISLAQGSNYLYNFGDKDSAAGILAPLRATNGVIFPYTPTIETNYHAKYNTVDLIHSNYRGYFYQNSYVDQINIKGTFTAQDTKEAQYLLAVIHFFRSVTKMFYGATDQYAGTPPPLVFLSGLGQYQFANHPCLVTNFTYSLPNDVDYIRADGFNQYNINMENRRTQSAGAAPGGVLAGSFSLAAKLGINKLFAGGIQTPPTLSTVNQQVNKNKAQNSTYVPTKMEISVQLLPTQTRQQVSQQFSVKEFANGSLLKKGFW